MKDELRKAVKHCAELAGSTKDANEALKFTQAAINAAQALALIIQIEPFKTFGSEHDLKDQIGDTETV